MKFSIVKKELKKYLDNIKKSRAFSKTDDYVVLKIVVKDGSVDFICSNIGIWACSSIVDNVEIESDGEVYVDGTNFINIVETYPQDAMLVFSEEKEKDGKVRLLLQYTDRKQEKQSAFLLITPDYFEDAPPNEDQKEVVVDTKSFVQAAKAVGFASSSHELERWMWGALIEVYDTDDISAFATDRSRIAWYDPKGFDYKRDKEFRLLNPIYPCLYPVLDCLDIKKDTQITYGENYTILKQDSQWHAIPNAIESRNEDDVLPDWRVLHKHLLEAIQTKISINKKALLQCIKTASYTSCKKYGLRFFIDTDNKEIVLAVDSTEVGGILKSYHKEKYTIDDNDISGEAFKGEIMMSVNSLKEDIEQINSDKITFCLIDDNSPMIIHGDESEHLKIIATGLE